MRIQIQLSTDADLESDFYLMRIWIRIFIWCGSGFLFDADPDPTFHPDADPDPTPSFQIMVETLEKVLK